MPEQRLIELAALVDGEAARVDVGPYRLSLVRLGDNVYVLGDRCTHAEASLSEGDVDPDELTITCPRHGAEFALADGEALTLPATRPVRSWTTSIVDGWVTIDDGADGDEASTEGGRPSVQRSND